MLTYCAHASAQRQRQKKTCRKFAHGTWNTMNVLFIIIRIKFESKINYAWRWNLAKIYNMQTTQNFCAKNAKHYATWNSGHFIILAQRSSSQEMRMFVVVICVILNHYMTSKIDTHHFCVLRADLACVWTVCQMSFHQLFRVKAMSYKSWDRMRSTFPKELNAAK